MKTLGVLWQLIKEYGIFGKVVIYEEHRIFLTKTGRVQHLANYNPEVAQVMYDIEVSLNSKEPRWISTMSILRVCRKILLSYGMFSDIFVSRGSIFITPVFLSNKKMKKIFENSKKIDLRQRDHTEWVKFDEPISNWQFQTPWGLGEPMPIRDEFKVNE